jgi:hypothetical protein
MKRIRHGAGTFLAEDLLADLVLTYAAVLANRRRVDVVAVPAMDDLGDVCVMSLLIGWQLPLSAATVDTPRVDDRQLGVLEQAAAELRGRIAQRTLGGAAHPIDLVALDAGAMA